MSVERPVAIYCGRLDGNSTAKISARLANAFVARGVPTDLLVTASPDPIPEPTDPAVRIVQMGRMGTATRVPRMTLYLRRTRPRVVLTHRIRENVLTQKAARIGLTRTPVFVTVHGPMGVKLQHMKGRKVRRRRAQVLRYYRRNQGIITISGETASDLHALLGAGPPIATIPNPIVTPEIHTLAAEGTEHPWLAEPRTIPVACFAGRLEQEKDLPTLLRAFAILVDRHPCRLVIIGDGSLRAEVESQREALGLRDWVDMPGWAANPYPFLAGADLVVLSSWWDALPTVLIESLALGTPVVSTECGAGPREILDGGRYGPLVPPRDPQALAAAMAQTLADPLPPQALRPGSERYEAQRNADRYLAFMLGDPPIGDGNAD
jgi:glycosyltransferase involved in cell wall biosynthesis